MQPRFQDPTAEMEAHLKPRRKSISPWWFVVLLLVGSQVAMVVGHFLWILESVIVSGLIGKP